MLPDKIVYGYIVASRLSLDNDPRRLIASHRCCCCWALALPNPAGRLLSTVVSPAVDFVCWIFALICAFTSSI